MVIVVDLDSVDAAKRDVEDFPLTKAGYLEWCFVPLVGPLPIQCLLDPTVDVAEPSDRTEAPSR